jgi:hypothetical protein
MIAIAVLVCVSMLGVSISTALVAGRPVPAPLMLDHKTLDFYGGPDDGWRRFELTATIAGERGEGQLAITVFNPNPAEPRDPLIRDLFGDRMDDVKPTSTEHKVTLKLIKSEDDLPRAGRRWRSFARARKRTRSPIRAPWAAGRFITLRDQTTGRTEGSSSWCRPTASTG